MNRSWAFGGTLGVVTLSLSHAAAMTPTMHRSARRVKRIIETPENDVDGLVQNCESRMD
jgi:hypothetical protein